MKEGTGRPAKISDLILSSLKGLDLEVELKKREALDLWEVVVGPELASRTEAVRIQNQLLFVKVVSAAWMQELQSLNIKGVIVKALNDRAGLSLVRDIKFMQGTIEPKAKAKAKLSEQEARSLSREEKSWMREVVSAVKDKELKAILSRAISRQLQQAQQGKAPRP